MADVNEVRRLKTSLESATGSEKIHEILVVLKKDVKPTEKLLRETKIGIAVNKLRTHSDKKISDLVKEIIKNWKDEVSAQKAKLAHAKASHTNKPAETAAINPTNGASATPTVEKSMSERFTNHGKPRNAKNDGVRTDLYSDKVRNSCIDLCYTAMALDSTAAPADILECAKSIELVVFEDNKGNTGPNYRNKMRSLYMNLKDKSNPQLRKRVVSGEITPQRLAKMTPQEMASEELKEEIERLDKQNLFKAQGATEKRATTDRFTCGKCKQKKVSYYQMQTRSADEPLTTFCTCENCGNRWKFS